MVAGSSRAISRSGSPARLTQACRQIQRQLPHIGYLGRSSVFEHTPAQQGSRYVWTRKVRAKTVTVALSQISGCDRPRSTNASGRESRLRCRRCPGRSYLKRSPTSSDVNSWAGVS
jgi:hypothetical protein